MIVVSGKSVSDDVAIGRLFFYKQDAHIINKAHIDDTAAEKLRFDEARHAAREELAHLYE